MIHNPVTGEQLRFVKTARDTGGEAVVVEVDVEPHGFVAAAHVHPHQDRDASRSSTARSASGRQARAIEARPGDVVVVEPGTAHKFWNVGDERAVFVTEVRPALQFEQLIETMFSLAADGKTNRKGMPNPLRLAVIARAHFDDVRLPFPPAWIQRAGLAMGAPVGQLLGYGATYVPAPGELGLAGA